MGFATGKKHVQKAQKHAFAMHEHKASALYLHSVGEHHAAEHHARLGAEHEALANKHFGLAEKHGYHKSFSEEAMNPRKHQVGGFYHHLAEAQYKKHHG